MFLLRKLFFNMFFNDKYNTYYKHTQKNVLDNNWEDEFII